MTLEKLNNELKAEAGTYILVLKSETNKNIKVGSLGKLEAEPGYYFYVGSALGPGGVQARVRSHYKQNQSKHWHIDYLREVCKLEAVLYTYSEERFEHDWAKILQMEAESMIPKLGFGASDCGCKAHLFFFASKLDLTDFTEKFSKEKINSFIFK
jgi:Uri superfamily endonuclease